MKIDILSDSICPWCYIGKRRLDRALETYGRDLGDVSTVWRAFQLNPDMPSEGMDRRAYLEGKFGGPQGAAEVYGRIAGAGKDVGIDFAFDKVSRTPNTIASHRLLRFAQIHGDPHAVAEALFEAYFLEGQDIGNAENLTEIGVSAGLEREALSSFLLGDAYADELRKEDAHARSSGVGGVPFFIVDDRYVLTGAQPEAAFHRIFDLILDGPGEAAESETA